jgi:hypothetical protein
MTNYNFQKKLVGLMKILRYTTKMNYTIIKWEKHN